MLRKKGLSLPISSAFILIAALIGLVLIAALFTMVIGEGEQDVDEQRNHSYVEFKLYDSGCCYDWNSDTGLTCDEIVELHPLHPQEMDTERAKEEICDGVEIIEDDIVAFDEVECQIYHPQRYDPITSMTYMSFDFYVRNHGDSVRAMIELELDGDEFESDVKNVGSGRRQSYRLTNLEVEPGVFEPYPDTEWEEEILIDDEYFNVKVYEVYGDGTTNHTHTEENVSVCEECDIDDNLDPTEVDLPCV